jgi:hypothetical protein
MAGTWAVPALRAGAGALAVGLVAGIVAVACETTTRPGTVTGAPRAAATTTADVAATSMPFNLYTHCGIGEARIGGRYYRAVRPLGAGNPPAGWGDPYQAGTMTLVSASEAVFTDRAGHRVVFRLRPGATAFRTVCS